MLFDLSGRTALVTGGSSGIGRAMAAALAGAGARVVLMARGEGPLREAASEMGATYVPADVGDRSALLRAAEAVGDVDILINAAAVNLRPPMDELTIEQWDTTIEVNLTAPFLLGQHFGPRMAERGWGRIINIVSQQATRAFGNSGAYGVSKAGLAGLSRSQAEAWSARGVTSNAVAPGFVHTPLTDFVASDPVRSRALAERTMIGRNGVPADFAGVAVWLAGPGSEYVTGQLISVDGGFSVH
ncbi:2-deoxy-D-gluconate 3-dehydrogenase [Virgisporangium aliadipatigenens]|uniref:2-deoxy-D-gluconate 3-dehydrogenase n=1 Tax=Virgisporangium aliadipatigenens TaxID=741659 RepID=A0A8J3YT22_9ACTN|nr:SDR family oxidoreductase [Virgisporangium aliadipatigenens]GIJ49957.1 2-deoxy-D-gluconate 3-dehydrogenase [Virgisporangium aliadipatigenens]